SALEASQYPDASVQAKKVAAAGQLVQSVDVLRDQRELSRARFGRCQRIMSRIGLGVCDQRPPPVVPFPYEFWIARERPGRGEFFSAILLPQTVVAAKRGHTALGRYPSAREHGDRRSVAQPFANSVHSFQSNPLGAHLSH